VPEIAFLNSAYMPIEDAKISINDRGFVYGDGVYEVMVAYGGHPFRMHQHLQRLKRSAAEIRLALTSSVEEIERVMMEGIERAGFDDTMVYLQFTRGVAPRKHSFPANTKPTFVATFREKPITSEQTRRDGVNLVTIEDLRWGACFVKSIALLPNVLAYQQAQDSEAFEAILHAADGVVHECSVSNIFFVQDGRIVTPAKTNKNLHGITRRAVLDFANDLDIPTSEEAVQLDAILAADEVFLSGTTFEVLGAVKIDDRNIANGTVGPVTQRVAAHFRLTIEQGRYE